MTKTMTTAQLAMARWDTVTMTMAMGDDDDDNDNGDGAAGDEVDDDGDDDDDGDGRRRRQWRTARRAMAQRDMTAMTMAIGGVIVVVAVVGIVGVDNGDAAFLLGGDDKGIVVEVVVRAAKKAG